MNQVATPLRDALPVDLANRLRLGPHGLGNVSERQRVSLAVHLDDQRAHDRQRHREAQGEDRPSSSLAGDIDRAAERVNRTGHDVEPHSPPCQCRDPLRRGQSRDEDQAVQLGRVCGLSVEAERFRLGANGRSRRDPGRRPPHGSRFGRIPRQPGAARAPRDSFPLAPGHRAARSHGPPRCS